MDQSLDDVLLPLGEIGGLSDGDLVERVHSTSNFLGGLNATTQSLEAYALKQRDALARELAARERIRLLLGEPPLVPSPLASKKDQVVHLGHLPGAANTPVAGVHNKEAAQPISQSPPNRLPANTPSHCLRVSAKQKKMMLREEEGRAQVGPQPARQIHRRARARQQLLSTQRGSTRHLQRFTGHSNVQSLLWEPSGARVLWYLRGRVRGLLSGGGPRSE